jgi:pimeloyl-ACP methyl ester carboxylesterase
MRHKPLNSAGVVEGFFLTGESRLNYVAGPANGPPIVFIPAQGMTWEEYALLLPMLAPDFQVFAVSLPGHGKSSWTPGEYTFDRLGSEVSAFLREVVGRPAIVGGNSSGGVLAMWLAANAPDLVTATIIEDAPFFRAEWPTIKASVVYDLFVGLAETAIPGGGGFPEFFLDTLVPIARQFDSFVDVPLPPKPVLRLAAAWMTFHQTLRPGTAIDLPFLPAPARIMLRALSQFDGNFSRAFVDGTVGAGFDHASTLARVTQPMLFLHANWFVSGDRIVGALTDDDVARVKSIIRTQFDYVRLPSGHLIPLERPELENTEIRRFLDQHATPP